MKALFFFGKDEATTVDENSRFIHNMWTKNRTGHKVAPYQELLQAIRQSGQS
jgi:hypothetical protein